ncbi:MAG: HEAT repeat domain-containing protein, partial [Candidatus Pacearchaeota archaeon]|nr:HEAT repeat domain-containing protein [Candidatus Pacearchaeota archaeon]
ELKDLSVIPKLAIHLNDKDEKVREAIKNALYSMSWSRDEICLAEYLKLLKYNNENVLDIAKQCLENIQNEDKIPTLKRLLKHQHPHIRIGAATILAHIARYNTKEDIIAAFLSESDEQVKAKFGKILESIGSSAAVSFLRAHHKDQDFSIEDIYKECLDLIYMIKDFSIKLDYLNKIGSRYIMIGQYTEAHALLDEIYDLIITHEKHENQAPGLISLIQTFSGILKGDKYRKIFEEALQAAENTGDKLRAAEFCRILGTNALSVEDKSTALILFNQACKFCHQKKIKNFISQINLWLDVAYGFIAAQEKERGIEILSMVKEEVLKPSFEDNYSTAVLLNTISYLSLGFAHAGKSKEAISLADSINEPEYNGILHADIGVIMHISGENKKVNQLFARAFKIAKNQYHASDCVRAYIQLAKRFLSIKNPQKSEELLVRSLHSINHEFEKADDNFRNELLGKIIEIYLLHNNISHAFSLTQMISDAAIKTHALIQIAGLFKAGNQYKETRKVLEMGKNTVIRILRSREQAPLLIKLAVFYNIHGERNMTTRLVQRAYQLAVCNREKDIIMAELAPLLVELIA